jgi:hypothetical protein
MSFQTFDQTGTTPAGGFWPGGAAGGAFAGGLAGGIVGDLLFDGRRGGRGGHHGGEGVVQINGAGWGSPGQWELFKEMSDTRRDVAVMPYITQNSILETVIANNAQFAGMARDIAASTNSTQRDIMTAQFQNALQLAGISREMAECCCKQLMATTVMGFETQLRDQTNMGILMKEIQEVKCMVKDAEKDGIIRHQAETIDGFRQAGIVNTITGRLGIGLNQIGVNQVNTAPTTSQWPPAFFAPGFM